MERNNLASVFKFRVHVSVPAFHDHTGEFVVAAGEREIEYRTALVKAGDFANQTDAVEGRLVLYD